MCVIHIKMKLDLDKIKLVNLFEKVTSVDARDCFDYNDKIVFLVPESKIFLAIGKNGRNVERLSVMLKKKIKIVVFSDDPAIFIKSFISPIKAEEIVNEGSKLIIKVSSVSDKAILIGRNSRNLKSLIEILKKYYKNVEKVSIQ